MMAWEKLDPTPADVRQLVAHAERVRYDHAAEQWVGDLSKETARAIVKALVSVADELTRGIPGTIGLARDAWELRQVGSAREHDERQELGTVIASAAALANQATGAAFVLLDYVNSNREVESPRSP